MKTPSTRPPQVEDRRCVTHDGIKFLHKFALVAKIGEQFLRSSHDGIVQVQIGSGMGDQIKGLLLHLVLVTGSRFALVGAEVREAHFHRVRRLP